MMKKQTIVYLSAAVIILLVTVMYLVISPPYYMENESVIDVISPSLTEITTSAEITSSGSAETALHTTALTSSSVTSAAVSFMSVVTSVSTETTAAEVYFEEVIVEAEEDEVTEEIFEEFLWIDINTAEAEELMKLTGVGEVTAGNIIRYREENGGFGNIEEIMLVIGIGEAVFENIRENIYVENPIYPEENEGTQSFFSEGENPVYGVFVEPETEPPTEHIRTLEECAPININTADVDELMLLPYVTEEIAEDIIKLREDIDGFSHVYELLYVEKLTQKQTAEIVNFVTVGQ